MAFLDSYRSLKEGGRRSGLKRAVLTVALIILIGAPLAVLALRRLEAAVTFHPERYAAGEAWRLPAGGEDVWFAAADGVRLHGWFVRAPSRPPAATVVYFHGNGGNLSYVSWLAGDYAARGFDVLLFDYRGYGRSEGEVTDERGIYMDADAAYEYVTRVRGVPAFEVVLHGQSLGTTAAVDLAAREPCGALVVESGLSSSSDMTAVLMPWLPRFTHRLARNRFESVRKVARAKCPVLVAHGERDEVIPAEQGRKLYDAAPEPKRLLTVPGAGHNDLAAVGGEEFLDAVARFIRDSVGRP